MTSQMLAGAVDAVGVREQTGGRTSSHPPDVGSCAQGSCACAVSLPRARKRVASATNTQMTSFNELHGMWSWTKSNGTRQDRRLTPSMLEIRWTTSQLLQPSIR